MKHKRRNIVLIGFMGSGKTTLGLKLSYLLRMPVEDTDKLIERQEGRSITQIFADDGESYFRELETELLRKCGEQKYERILSVGGGTPVNPVNRPLLHQCGTVVYLRVSPEVVYERLKNDTTRPLLQCEDPLTRIRELLEIRDKIYAECADIILDVDNRHSDELAEELQLQLRKQKDIQRKKERKKTKEILSQVKIVDLSADYRIKDVATYEKWYGIEHKSPQFIEEAVYGLCEINRDKITEKTRLVANPGCYTTCSILTAYPMVKEGMIDVNTLIVDAKSGTSGAGRGAKVPNLFCEVNENMKAYGVASHRHTPEIEEQLGYAGNCQVTINFTPHLVPMNRGILATEYATLKRKPDGTLPTYEEVKAVYDKYYANEKFVRVLDKGSCPETKWVEGSNYVDINFVIDERTGRIIMMGALDNLVKGAAGQAVQNMNLLFGLPESEGLELVPCFP